MRTTGSIHVSYTVLGTATALSWPLIVAVCGGYDLRTLLVGVEELRRVVRMGVSLLALLGFVFFAVDVDLSRGYVASLVPFVVLFTGYLGAALDHTVVMQLLELQLVLTGCLFALPLLGVEVLPVWCTQPVRMTFAAVDGLLDAIPGIAVMTSTSLVAHGYYAGVDRGWGPSRSWDQAIAGGLMITVAEVVAVPFIAILFRAWIREDAFRAQVIDEALDVAEAKRHAVAPTDTEADVERPWWEVDPGPLSERAARYGWRERE